MLRSHGNNSISCSCSRFLVGWRTLGPWWPRRQASVMRWDTITCEKNLDFFKMMSRLHLRLMAHMLGLPSLGPSMTSISTSGKFSFVLAKYSELFVLAFNCAELSLFLYLKNNHSWLNTAAVESSFFYLRIEQLIKKDIPLSWLNWIMWYSTKSNFKPRMLF